MRCKNLLVDLVGLEEVRSAFEVLTGVAVRTPLEYSRAVSDKVGGPTYLKCENLQRTGAFKIRGAYNCLYRLSDQERSRGVVAASAGNHAQGVALAAKLLDVEATVFMPEGASLPKMEATESYGATVTLAGAVYDEAFQAAQAYAAGTGAVMVHPFEHPDVIAGQGTISIELLEQLPELRTIVVPVGGGGLISGIAAAAKGLDPNIRIIGVEPEGAANVGKSLGAGKLVELPEISTVADGLAAKQAGEMCLAHIRELVDDVITVTDDEIAEALLMVVERAKLVVEPAGAAGVAAMLTGKAEVEFPAAVVLSGGNIDPLLLLRVIRFGMGSSGRYFWFRTRVSDRPGELHRLIGVLADSGANIVGVEHHREGASLQHLGEVEVAVQVESRGIEHVDDLRVRLKEAGYLVEPL